MYFEPPQLAYWDAAKNNWRLDAFTDSQYSEGKSHWSQASFKRSANYMKSFFFLIYVIFFSFGLKQDDLMTAVW